MNPQFCQILPKMHEIERIWTSVGGGWHASPRTPPPPPPRSSNDCDFFTNKYSLGYVPVLCIIIIYFLSTEKIAINHAITIAPVELIADVNRPEYSTLQQYNVQNFETVYILQVCPSSLANQPILHIHAHARTHRVRGYIQC